jgi:hypothetical protein
MHAFFSKVMDESSLFGGEVSAHYCQILTNRSVRKKLFDQRVAIARSLDEEENSGGKAVDAMDDQGALSTGLQVLRD